MRVLCCHTSLRDKTRAALERYAPQAEFADVSGDDYAYWREIAKRWGGGEDLLVVEHDIEIHEDVIDQFELCRADWCVFPYAGKQPVWGGRGVRVPVMLRCALGCVRFRSSLLHKYPSLVADLKYRRWDRLDSQIATLFPISFEILNMLTLRIARWDPKV